MANRNFNIDVTIGGIKQGIKDFSDLTGATKAFEKAQDAAAKGSKVYQAAASKTQKTLDLTKKALTPFGKLFQAGGKAGKVFSAGLKGIGTALKGVLAAGGVTLVIGKLVDILKASQPVMDLFQKATIAIQIVFQKLSDAIKPVIDDMIAASGSFDATKEVLTSLLTIGIQPFILSFNLIKLGILSAMEAWESSFFGGGDEKKIAKLNEQIKETKDNIIEVGKTLIKEGADVINNIGEAVSEVAEGAAKIYEAGKKAIEDIDFKDLNKESERLVELQKAAARADIERQKIQIQYQKTQEELRQDRDDETKNLSDRIKANDDLLKSQQEQADLEKRQIQIKIAAAAAENNIFKTEESRNALAQANLELLELDERITGQKSEALANQNTLAKEQLELQRTLGEITEADYDAQTRRLAEAEVAQKRRQTESIRNVNERAQAEFEIEQEYLQKQLDLERELYDSQSQATLDRLAELETTGQTETQEYADLLARKSEADQAYADKAQELSDQIADNEAKNTERTLEVKRSERQQILELTASSLGAIAGILNEVSKDDEKRAKRNFETSKKLSIAESIISTYAAINKIFSEKTLPFPSNVIAAVGVGAQGFANVLKIRNTKFQGTEQEGDEGPKPFASKFAEGGLLKGPRHSQGGIKTGFGELEGGEFVVNRRSTQKFFGTLSAINQAGKRRFAEGGIAGVGKSLEKALMETNQQQPIIKTYVVASEMSSQQEADKRVRDIASL